MRVLVIDDSVVFRTAIKTSLLNSSEVSEVQVASNGKTGIDFLKNSKFDGITIDLEMPVMDGPETIKAIREFDEKIPIIIFSSQNTRSANKTLMALDMGANDFVQKTENQGNLEASLKNIQNELIPKFKGLLQRCRKSENELVTSEKEHASPKPNLSRDYLLGPKPGLICIGSSTGGPDALKKIFENLKPGIKTPILIVQHMPPLFTTQLAMSLNSLTDLDVIEAKDGQRITQGKCYIAPGDFHMKIEKVDEHLYIRLDQSEKVCFVRPSVDVTLESLAKNYRGIIGSIILTGMGLDGLEGTKKIKKTGGFVLIQDEQSSTVWGMPKAIYDAGHFDDVLANCEFAEIINKLT